MEGDKPIEEIIEMIKEVMADNPFAECYVKWTCPGCGQRCTANKPNEVHLGGMRHEECGTVHTGPLWGLMVIYPLFDEGQEPLRG